MVGRPSLQHEKCRSTLDAVAVMAGFDTPIRLPDGKVPDVVRGHLGTGTFFIGDAKHTESARDMSTLGRLESYMSWLARPRDTSVPDFFCVCHPRTFNQDLLGTLHLISVAVGVATGHKGVFDLTSGTAVSWITCYGSSVDLDL